MYAYCEITGLRRTFYESVPFAPPLSSGHSRSIPPHDQTLIPAKRDDTIYYDFATLPVDPKLKSQNTTQNNMEVHLMADIGWWGKENQSRAIPYPGFPLLCYIRLEVVIATTDGFLVEHAWNYL